MEMVDRSYTFNSWFMILCLVYLFVLIVGFDQKSNQLIGLSLVHVFLKDEHGTYVNEERMPTEMYGQLLNLASADLTKVCYMGNITWKSIMRMFLICAYDLLFKIIVALIMLQKGAEPDLSTLWEEPYKQQASKWKPCADKNIPKHQG